MSNDAEIYRRKMSLDEFVPDSSYKGKNKNQPKERYTAPKGTADRAKRSKARRRKKMRIRLASLVLAAGVGIGGLTYVGSLNKEPEHTITELQEMGIEANNLGLGSDTLEMMKKYDEYFDGFDKEEHLNLTDNEVIDMISEIEDLNFNVIKDKIASLRSANRDDIKLDYRFDEGTGTYNTAITINEGEYGKEEVYTNGSGLLDFSKENTIPKDVSDLIVQIGKYSVLSRDLKADDISKVNAIKRLEELYGNISGVATKEFTMDEKGNIGLEEYDTKDIAKDVRAGEER